MTDHLVAALVAAVASGSAAYVAPAVVAALPEPEESGSLDGAQKVPYTELAARPALGLRFALVAAVAAGGVGARLGWNASLPLWCFLCVLGVVLGYVDWRTRLLPFRLVAPSYAVSVALLLLAAVLSRDWHGLLRAALAWAIVYAVFAAMWAVYRRGLGYGDVRLSGILAMALGWLGWPTLVVGVYAGFVLGAVGGIGLSLLHVVDRKAYPFGPFMLLGAWTGVVLGPAIAGGFG